MKTRIFTFLMLLLCLPVAGWGQTSFPTDSWLDYADTDWYTNNTSATSYTITTAAELAGMAKLALWDKIRGCVEFDGKTITLDVEGGELDLSAHEWFPIGRKGSYDGKIVGAFKGTFDGKGCKIKGLYIDEAGDNASCFGLFGILSTDGDGTAEIKDIHIESGHIRAGYRVGGVCGYSSGGTITNCSNAITIELHPGAAVITHLGGICGQLAGNTSKIENCTNSGDILATDESYTMELQMGGICGSSSVEGDLISCNNKGDIQAVIQNNGYIGGISGMAVGDVESCYNTGDISVRAIGSSTNSDYTGGVAGYYQGGELSQSYNTGAITVTIENSKHWTGGYGGVVGYNQNGTIQSCYNAGSLSLLGNSSYYNYFGGVCGRLYGTNTLMSSYNAGTMNAEVPVYLGGVVGRIWTASTISGNFNVGDLTSSYDSNFGAICGGEDGNSSASIYSENGYLSGSDIKGYGDGTDKTGMTEMSSSEIVTAINTQLTSEKGWATTASYSASTLTLPKLSNNAEEEAPTVLVWEDLKAEISPEATDGWYGSEVTLKAPEGFEISLEENGTYAESVTYSEEGEQELTYYLKKNDSGETHEYTASIKIDLTAPTVDVNTNYENYTLTLSDGEGSGIASLKIDGVEIDLSAWEEGVYSATGSEGKHTYEVTDKVGHATTGTFTLNAETETPVLPDYPSYYNIYVEACEGVTVETSTNVVREGTSMTFTIDIAEGYTAKNMTVTVKRSLFGYTETIEPNEEGIYEVKNIYTDIYVTIDGVEEETPTGIEEVTGAKVYTKEGSIYVYTPTEEQVTIISMSGAVLKNEKQTGLKQYSGLNRGVYIICIGDERVKVRN